MEDLRRIFEAYAFFGDRTATVALLDTAKFAKLCKECAVVDRIVTPTQVDLIFAKVKTKGERKISFDQFLSALQMVATMKFPDDPDAAARVHGAILASGGPKLDSVTSPVKSSIFDKLTDTSLYTGAHKHRFDDSGRGRGIEGRESVAAGAGTVSSHHGGPVSDLSQITRSDMRGGTHLSSASAQRRTAVGASPPLARGPSFGGAAGTRSPPASARELVSPTGIAGGTAGTGAARGSAAGMGGALGAATARPASPPHAGAGGGGAGGSFSGTPGGGGGRGGGGGDLFGIFRAYAAFGGTSASSDELDSAKFAKLCKESGIFDKRVGPPAADVAFSKVKTKGRRTVNFEQFKQALALLALEKFAADEPAAATQRVMDAVLAAGGPKSTSASKPATGGIFDKLTDASLYTGAHKHRFDDSGRGRGIEGRDSIHVGAGQSKYHGGPVSDLSQLVRR